MSSVTPGRVTDALVAEKLGWVIETHDNKPPHFHRTENKSQWTWLEDWKPSTSPADAISALEATGKSYAFIKHEDGAYGCGVDGQKFKEAPTLCLAACAAILQLPTPHPPEPA